MASSDDVSWLVSTVQNEARPRARTPTVVVVVPRMKLGRAPAPPPSPCSGSRRTPKRQSPALIKSLFPRDKPASATPTSPCTTASQAYADVDEAVAAPVPPSRPHQRYSAIRGVLCLPRAPMDLGGGGAAPHLPFSSASSPLLRSRDSPTPATRGGAAGRA